MKQHPLDWYTPKAASIDHSRIFLQHNVLLNQSTIGAVAALTLPMAEAGGFSLRRRWPSSALRRKLVLRLLHERSGRFRVPGSRKPCGTVCFI